MTSPVEPPRTATASIDTTREDRAATIAVTLFPILILAGGVVAFLFPSAFTGWGALVTPALGIIMFGMGLTLTPPDFAQIASGRCRWCSG